MNYFWGMHGCWWVFWFLVWISYFSFMMPMRRVLTGKCNRLYSSDKGDMPQGRSQARNTKSDEPNSCGMPIQNRDISWTIVAVDRPEVFSAIGEQTLFGGGDSAVMTTDSSTQGRAGRRPPRFGIVGWPFIVVLAVVMNLLAQDMVRHRFFRGGWVNRNGSISP